MTKKAFEKIAEGLEEARRRVMAEVETNLLVEDNREDSPAVRRIKVKHEP